MLTYRSAIAYLDSFVNYEKKNSYPYARAFKLDRMRAFLSSIGDPHRSFKSIHVAGTKGKGSVCVFCTHILREAGLRVGLYTSPHLNDVRERIRVLEPRNVPVPGGGAGTGLCPGGAGARSCADFEGMVSREEFRSLVARLKPRIERFNESSPYGPLTFFEVYTALAFVHFREKAVDCAVLETGLGGRLDATNVVSPVACAITSISLDHTQKLGKTLAAIAREKAGIIKPLPPGCWAVSAPQKPGVREVIEQKCGREKVPVRFVGREIAVRHLSSRGEGQRFGITGAAGDFPGLVIGMSGTHQAVNAAVATALSLGAARGLGVKIGPAEVARGLRAAFWPGRFEMLGERFVLDGAHNGDSARVLARTLRQVFPGRPVTVILGVSRDKKLDAICRQLLRVSRRFIATQSRNPRSFPAAEIARRLAALDRGARVEVRGDIGSSISRARSGGPKDICCITGSLFLVGEARELLREKKYA